MKRAFCVFATLLNDRSAQVVSKMKLVNNFKEWKFKNPPSYAELPIDENPAYNEPVAVLNAVFSKVPTESLTGNIRLVCASEDALKDLFDLEPAVAESEDFISFVAGKYLPSGGLTVSHRYGGYQFGFWADQLGDGRAHILGEYINSKGESWQPQLKGSGETPYSRFGDGRAVLRSSVREMLASEAMHHLGVPTTRAAALVVSDDHMVWRDKTYSGRARQERAAVGMRVCPAWYKLVSDDHMVWRDKTYSGRARQERAAVVMRVCPAWYRLGSFEILDKRKEPHTMKKLFEFIIKHHFPSIDNDDEDRFVKFYTEVAHRNLDMVATWQGVGFTHGVLNTDNVSILGVTIDYGPYGFIDHYYGGYVPNTSDDLGRYAFDKQPQILLWNLEKFAAALQPILPEDQKLKIKEIQATLEEYVNDKVLSTYLLKLGMKHTQDGDRALVDDLLNLMQDTMADFTCTFRQLAETAMTDLEDVATLETKWSLNKLRDAKGWSEWVGRYRKRIDKENVSEEDRRVRMTAVNPVYVPRNWMMQEAIADAENNDFTKVRFLLELFRNPYQVNEEAERLGYSAQPPSWAYGLKLSCSS